MPVSMATRSDDRVTSLCARWPRPRRSRWWRRSRPGRLYLDRVAGEPLARPTGHWSATGRRRPTRCRGLDRLLRRRGGARAAPACASGARVRRGGIRPHARAAARARRRERRHRAVEPRLRPKRRSKGRTRTCPRSARSTSAPASSSTASPSLAARAARRTRPVTRLGCLLRAPRAGDRLAWRDGRAPPSPSGRSARRCSATLFARQVLDERSARVAALLLAMAPGALLFGATSADAVLPDPRPARPPGCSPSAP